MSDSTDQRMMISDYLENMTNISEALPGSEPTTYQMQSLDLISFIIFFIVMVVGLTGNSLVIYVVLHFFKMQTVTNFYIANLAVADEVFLVSIPFVLITMWLGSWPFGNVACKIYWTVTSTNQFTSSLLLTVMSADRYLAVCRPLSCGRWRTLCAARLFCGIAWSVSAVMVVPLLIYARDQNGHCSIFWPETVVGIRGEVVFTLYTFVVTFALPIAAVVFFYSCVLLRLRAPVSNVSAALPKAPTSTIRTSAFPSTSPAQDREVPEDDTERLPCNRNNPASDSGLEDSAAGSNRKTSLRPIEKRRNRRRRRVTRLVLAIILVYFFCYLPFWVTQLWLLAQTGKNTKTIENAEVTRHGDGNEHETDDFSNNKSFKNVSDEGSAFIISSTSSASATSLSSSEPPDQKSDTHSRQHKSHQQKKNQQRDRSAVVFIFMLAFALTYCNSAINPLLYTFLSENFRTSFGKAWKRSRLNTTSNAPNPGSSLPLQQLNRRNNYAQHQPNCNGQGQICLTSGETHHDQNPVSSFEVSVNRNNATVVTTIATPKRTVTGGLTVESVDCELSADSTPCHLTARGRESQSRVGRSRKETLFNRLAALKHFNTWV